MAPDQRLGATSLRNMHLDASGPDCDQAAGPTPFSVHLAATVVASLLLTLWEMRLAGANYCLCTVTDTELHQDRRHIVAHRLCCEVQLGSDLGVAPANREQSEHVVLALGQSGKGSLAWVPSLPVTAPSTRVALLGSKIACPSRTATTARTNSSMIASLSSVLSQTNCQ